MKNPNATVTSVDEFNALDSSVTAIVFDNGVGEVDFTELDLTRFSQLRSLVVGDHSFSYVETVNITGLEELESIEIGKNSFTKYKNREGYDPERQFYLKDCPKLKSLKVGRFSFSDYAVIEIENVDALEVIEMGELINTEEFSCNFYYASLELNSAYRAYE